MISLKKYSEAVIFKILNQIIPQYKIILCLLLGLKLKAILSPGKPSQKAFISFCDWILQDCLKKTDDIYIYIRIYMCIYTYTHKHTQNTNTKKAPSNANFSKEGGGECEKH